MTNKELKEKYNINVDNLSDGLYDANIIVQCFGKIDCFGYLDDEPYIIQPLIYMPRKETCYCDEVNLQDEEEKENYLKHLRDSQERLKILALLLHQQEEEIIEFGYPKSSCYYPDLVKIHNYTSTKNE